MRLLQDSRDSDMIPKISSDQKTPTVIYLSTKIVKYKADDDSWKWHEEYE